MSPALAVPAFACALVVTLVAAALFAQRLDRVGTRLGLTEALLGVLTAVAADGPEISSAITALVQGERDVGIGVVLGSNVFNLAAMVGVGAIVAGAVRPRRESLALEAVVATAVTAAAAGLLFGVLAPVPTLVVLALVLVPYVALLLLGDRRVHVLPLPARAHAMLRVALGEGIVRHRPPGPHEPLWRPLCLMALALVGIVGGSIVMVDASLALADAAGLGHALDGLLVLAVVTSLPNAATALRLARQGRGDATVSETMNSNTINLVGGIVVPAVVVGLGAVDAGVRGDVVWMCALTAATLLALARPSGMGRVAGAALVVAYLAFVLAHVV